MVCAISSEDYLVLGHNRSFCSKKISREVINLYINLYSPRNGSNTKTQWYKITNININKTKAAAKSIISKWRFVLNYKHNMTTNKQNQNRAGKLSTHNIFLSSSCRSGSVAEWVACWTQAQKGPGSNRSRDAVG